MLRERMLGLTGEPMSLTGSRTMIRRSAEQWQEILHVNRRPKLTHPRNDTKQ